MSFFSRATIWTCLPLLLVSSPALAESKLSASLQMAARRAPLRPLTTAVRFTSPPNAAERAALRAEGITLEDAPLASGAFVAHLAPGKLDALARHGSVRSVADAGVSPFLRLLDLPMLDATRTSNAMRAALGARGLWLDGSGETLADVDSDAFVFHPSLFRADAGAFGWIDVDGDGSFRPGKDAIDANRNGVVDADELAQAVSVEFRDLAFQEFDPHTDFDATLDYLFLDANGNGRRDFGSGFEESTPAFGEPLFVVDDANGNGRLDPAERVLRLGTSKFAKIRLSGKTFERGNGSGSGILDYGTKLLRRFASARSPEHGTYMTAVMAGGNGSHRIRGIAPGADIILVPEPELADMSWLATEKAVAVSLPIGGTLGSPLDGSSELERAVDAYWEHGMLPSVSVGNDGNAAAHATLTLEPDQSVSIPFDIWSPTNATYFSVLVHDANAQLELETSDDAGNPLAQDGYAETSPRGTHFRLIGAVTQGLTGRQHLKVTLHGATEPREVQLFTLGELGYGVRFLEHVTVTSTVGAPATADNALAATGYVLHPGESFGMAADSEPGALAAFASRGPRVDGRALLGLATPVNPIGATVMADDITQIAVRAWPGTSCSAPQIAAAAALLHQANPQATATELRDALTTHARQDSFVTDDPNVWGAGKLDLAASLGLAQVSSTPPTITLITPASVVKGQAFEVRIDVGSADPSTLSARWDVDYDGAWDTPFAPLAPQSLRAPDSLLPSAVRVELHDAAGNLVGAAALVPTTDAPVPNPPGEAPRSEPNPEATEELGAGSGGCAMQPAPTTSLHSVFALLTLGLLVRAGRRK